jgi:putative hydroxymethylpyrimidine transport system substrate-binding protein
VSSSLTRRIENDKIVNNFGRVAGAAAFWNDGGVTLRRRSPGFHVFRVDQYGAPSYPELIVCATGASLRAHPELAREVVRALTEGYDQVLRDPTAGLRALTGQVPGLDGPLQAAELRALLPAFDQPGGAGWARSIRRGCGTGRSGSGFGIVSSMPRVTSMFSSAYGAPR